MKAAQAFYAYDEDKGQTVLFSVDEEVPDHVAALVGDHVLDEPFDRSGYGSDDAGEGGSAFDGEAFDQAVAAKVAEVVEERELTAVAAYQERETAAYEAEGYGTFDPAGEGVTAKAVADYLTGLDVESVAGQREYDRVVELEKAGPNRSTAIPS